MGRPDWDFEGHGIPERIGQTKQNLLEWRTVCNSINYMMREHRVPSRLTPFTSLLLLPELTPNRCKIIHL
jgi:hypothetical protein